MPLAPTGGSSFSPDTRPPAARPPRHRQQPRHHHAFPAVFTDPATATHASRHPSAPRDCAPTSTACPLLASWGRGTDGKTRTPWKPIAPARYTEYRSTRLTRAVRSVLPGPRARRRRPGRGPGRQCRSNRPPGVRTGRRPLSRDPGCPGIRRPGGCEVSGRRCKQCPTTTARLRTRLCGAGKGTGRGRSRCRGAVIEGALRGSRDGEHHEEPAVGAHAARDGRARLRQRAGAPGRQLRRGDHPRLVQRRLPDPAARWAAGGAEDRSPPRMSRC